MPRLAAVAFLAVAQAQAAPQTAAIANLGPPGADARAAISSLRRELAAAGLELVRPGPLRDALESPLDDSPDPPLSAAKADLDKAREAYESFELDDALATLEGLDRIAPDLPTRPAARALLAERHLLSGLVELQRNRAANARRDFRLAHRLEPTRTTLDPGTYRPSAVAAYLQAVADNQKAPAAKAPVRAEPADATIAVDGVVVSSTTPLSAGPHWVVVTRPGFQAQSSIVDLQGRGDPTTIALVPMAGPDRIRDLRRAAVNRALDLEQLVAELAASAKVDVLMVIRDSEHGMESATYRRSDDRLGDFAPLGATTISAATATTQSSSAASNTALTESSVKASSSEAPWYGRWWGTGLLAVGGAAVVSTALYFTFFRDDQPQARIDQWCFEGC